MTTPSPRLVLAALLFIAQGIVLPGLSLARDVKQAPENTLAASVLRRLAESSGYARIDSAYETNKAARGEAWTRLPEAQAMFRVREAIRDAARSAAIDTHSDGSRVVVFTQGGRKIPLTAVVPEEVEENAAVRNDVAGMIARYIAQGASEDANYQGVIAAIHAAENPPLPDIDRRAVTMVSGAIVEAPVASPLGLPLPGPSSKAKLLPSAESARQRGLKAAGSGDWPAAVAAFKEASKLAYASPTLMFNLGLAYQQGGWPVQAALYYRAYLAALPEAPNAAEVRAQLPGLIAEIEARSKREFDEAERLTDKLPATPPAAGIKSLRQSALETMARYAFMGGLTERGEALRRKAAALGGVGELAETDEYPDRHGLYAAAYAWDARGVEEIVARSGNAYTPQRIFEYRSAVLARRGDWDELRKVAEAFPQGLLPADTIGGKAVWMKQADAFDLLEVMHGLNLDAAGELYVGTLLPDIHTVFWGGRPDIGQRLARRAVAQYRKFYPEGSPWPPLTYQYHLIPNAVLGDRQAIVQEMARWKAIRIDDFLAESIIEVAAIYMAASMTPADAQATIMEMVKSRYNAIFKASGINLPETNWPRNFPEAYFAIAITQGNSAAALKYLERDDAPSSAEYRTRMLRGLRFAVATGRSQLAFELAEKLPEDLETFHLLNRLAANPAASELVRERVGRYGAALSGGWRPADAEHAQKTWRYLKHANQRNDETQYGVMSRDAESIAKDKPEKLPVELAGHAVVLWIGALAARLDD
jgi:hypothetical protein